MPAGVSSLARALRDMILYSSHRKIISGKRKRGTRGLLPVIIASLRFLLPVRPCLLRGVTQQHPRIPRVNARSGYRSRACRGDSLVVFVLETPLRSCPRSFCGFFSRRGLVIFDRILWNFFLSWSSPHPRCCWQTNALFENVTRRQKQKETLARRGSMC